MSNHRRLRTNGGGGSAPAQSFRAPDEGVPFEVMGPEVTFSPYYYPERLNIKGDTEIEEYPKPCQGQTIDQTTIKNARIHVTGLATPRSCYKLKELRDSRDVADLVTPTSDRGGMEVIVKTSEHGTLAGYDPQLNTWLMQYTADFVSTGRDEFGPSERSSVVGGYVDSAEARETPDREVDTSDDDKRGR